MQYKPHDYQRFCIERVIDMPAIGLFLDPGLGKTSISLTGVADLLYNRFSVNKVLVIAPKKVAEDTWTREKEKWDHLHLLRMSIVLESEKKRLQALHTPADVYIINRDNVVWLVEYYKNKWPFDAVILDESSSFKNHKAKRFKALKTVRAKIQRIILLTGTPSPEGLIDLWAQIYLLDGGERLGKTIGKYRSMYFDPDKRNATTIFNYKPQLGANEAILEKISDICFSLRAEDYLKMPERIDDVRMVKLDAKAEKAYRELEREMLLEIDEETIDAGTAAVLSGKLQQLCNGAVYDKSGKVIHIHDCKLEAFMELVEELNGKPTLVAYNFQHDRDRLLAALSKAGYKACELKTPENIAAWNRGEVDIMLAHPASAAYGLNLQDGGSHIIWFGLNWSLELYLQFNARVYRQGQKDTVIIHHLVVDGCRDADIMNSLGAKSATQDTVLDSLKARIREVKQEKCK